MLDEERQADNESRGRAAASASPWLFVVLLAMTTVAIYAGIFHIEPVTRIVRWLALVL